MMFPAPPEDGGFLVLTDAQIGNFDLVCAIKSAYPHTRIYAQRKLPTRNYAVLHPEQEEDIRGLSREARRVMSIGNPPAGPTGMLGYMVRRDPTVRAIHEAVDKIRANSF